MIHDERFNSERRATALHAGIEKKESNLHHCTVLLLDFPEQVVDKSILALIKKLILTDEIVRN
jgi:hypothetical protein